MNITTLIIILAVFGIFKNIIKENEKEKNTKIQSQRKEPEKIKSTPYVSQNQKVMNNNKMVELIQESNYQKLNNINKKVQSQSVSSKNNKTKSKLKSETGKMESIIQRYENKEALQRIETVKQKEEQSKLILKDSVLENIEFPEVLYSGLKYMNIPDTLPSFDIDAIAKIEVGTRSEGDIERRSNKTRNIM